MTARNSKEKIGGSLAVVFRRIRRRERFESAPLNDIARHQFETLVIASFAKCLDFNIAVNRARRYDDEHFIFVSGLRGICEDLISLSYISKMKYDDREEISRLRIRSTVQNGLEVQRNFFQANNPFQPILSPPKDEGVKKKLKGEIDSFWKRQGIGRSGGPNVKEMASNVKLDHTYAYVYFVSSNFVHFNPQALLRMGWGGEQGPFKFSAGNFSNYYKSLASFYGAIIFIGFFSAFGAGRLSIRCEDDVKEIIDYINRAHRWPEVVTYEEMNQRPPMPYFIANAMRHVSPLEGAPPGILAEVRGLESSLPSNPSV